MGGPCVRICVERGLGGTVVVTPIAIEVWMSSWWNDWSHVIWYHGSHAPRTLCAVVHVPSAGMSVVVGGPRGSQLRPRALRVPRVRRKYAEGVERSHAYVARVGRGRDCFQWARRAQGLAAGSGEAEIVC
jgi:hypothetical protein